MAVYTLPDLPYDYAALEPHINGQIPELHHDKHHAAYVKGANDTLEQIAEASRQRQLRQPDRAGKDPGVQPVRAPAAHPVLAEHVPGRR